MRLPDGGRPAVGALAVDDMAQGPPDRPLPCPGVRVDLRVGERGEKTVQVPAGRVGRSDERGREAAVATAGSHGARGRDLSSLEQLVDAVDGVANLLLTPADPRPLDRKGPFGDGQDVGGDRGEVGSRLVDRGRERTRAARVGVVEELGVDGRS